MGLDGLRATAPILNPHFHTLILKGTALVITAIIETLQNLGNEGAEPTFFQCSVFQGAILYRLHYARRSVHDLSEPGVSKS